MEGPTQAKSSQDPISTVKNKYGVMCLSYQLRQEAQIGRLQSRMTWEKIETLFQN
jgi:hypothetical protein